MLNVLPLEVNKENYKIMKKTILLFGSVILGIGFASAQSLPVATTPKNKNAVLEELTGIKCQYCPDGHKRANQVAAANPGRVVLVNIHAGGYAQPSAGQPDLRTPAGNAIDGFFDPDGYPAGSVQRTPFGSETVLATSRTNWTSMVNSTLNQPSPVNVAMDAQIDAATRQVTVTVEIYYTTPFPSGTNNYLNIGFVQNNFEGPQVGASLNPTAIQPNGKYLHQHIFRGFINANGTWGEPIDASQTGVITKTVTYTLPASIASVPLDMGELQFFAFVHQGHAAYNTSKILTAAEVDPTYINTGTAKADLVSIVNDFNIGCSTSGSVSPVVKVKNTGAEITSLSFSTDVNGGTPATYNWTGNIPSYGTAEITIPTLDFTAGETSNLNVTLTSVNGGSGTVGTTSTVTKAIAQAGTAIGTAITLEVMTDNYPTETSWEIRNSSNAVVASGGPYVGNANGGGADALKVKSHNVVLPSSDCYSVKLIDEFGDGLQYGVNPGGGFGFRILQGTTLKYSHLKSSYDFGDDVTVNGVLNFTLGLKENEEVLTMFNIYPNPATDEATLEIATSGDSKVSYKILNALGQAVLQDDLGSVNGQKVIQVNTSALKAGIYFVNFNIDGVSTQQPLSVIR